MLYHRRRTARQARFGRRCAVAVGVDGVDARALCTGHCVIRLRDGSVTHREVEPPGHHSQFRYTQSPTN